MTLTNLSQRIFNSNLKLTGEGAAALTEFALCTVEFTASRNPDAHGRDSEPKVAVPIADMYMALTAQGLNPDEYAPPTSEPRAILGGLMKRRKRANCYIRHAKKRSAGPIVDENGKDVVDNKAIVSRWTIGPNTNTETLGESLANLGILIDLHKDATITISYDNQASLANEKLQVWAKEIKADYQKALAQEALTSAVLRRWIADTFTKKFDGVKPIGTWVFLCEHTESVKKFVAAMEQVGWGTWLVGSMATGPQIAAGISSRFLRDVREIQKDMEKKLEAKRAKKGPDAVLSSVQVRTLQKNLNEVARRAENFYALCGSGSLTAPRRELLALQAELRTMADTSETASRFEWLEIKTDEEIEAENAKAQADAKAEADMARRVCEDNRKRAGLEK